MAQEQTFEMITVDALLERVRALHKRDYRLVQIGATLLSEQVELTYSFDLDGRLVNLRLNVPAVEARVPSISSLYWCAFLYENEMHDLFNVRVDGMAVDFHGHLYKTSVKHAFGSTKAPSASNPALATAVPAAPSAQAASAAADPLATPNSQPSTRN